MGSYDIILMGNAFWTFKFICEENKLMVKTKGSWLMAGKVLPLVDWRKNFRPFEYGNVQGRNLQGCSRFNYWIYHSLLE